MAMDDNVSKAKSRLHRARETREERAAEFWRNTINLGRVQRQTEVLRRKSEEVARKTRQPKQ
jgi:hypothetical protein